MSFLFVTLSPGKLLDVDDQYYQQLSSSRSQLCIATKTADGTYSEGRSPDRKQPAGGQVREWAATEPESHKTDGDNRQVHQYINPPANQLLPGSLPVSSVLKGFPVNI